MRKYASTFILGILMLLSELHTFWKGDKRIVNWIWAIDRKMEIQWNVKYLVGEIWFIGIMAAWLLYVKNRINYTTIVAYLIWFICDLGMYFYNYKTGGYWKVYYWIVPIWIITYLWKGKTQDKLFKTIHPT